LAPQGCSPAISPVFLRELKTFDRGLELVWNGHMNHWVLYRVVERAPARCDDYMFKEIELCGPGGQYRALGFWVFDVLRGKALARYHPDPDRQMEALCTEHEKADEKRDKDGNDEIVTLTNDMVRHRRWAEKGRMSVNVENNPAAN
jgi:hypothetical protein